MKKDTQDITFWCERCGTLLTANLDIGTAGDIQFTVEPCKKCIDRTQKILKELFRNLPEQEKLQLCKSENPWKP